MTIHCDLIPSVQAMDDDDLQRFTRYIGPFGDEPFLAPVPGREHVVAVSRPAEEQAPLFAGSWHTDWSFQAKHPAGGCLFGVTIPPSGGYEGRDHLLHRTTIGAL